MGFLGVSEVGIIAFVIIMLFGATKLPKLGGAIGQSIKNFRNGIRELDDSTDQAVKRERSDE